MSAFDPKRTWNRSPERYLCPAYCPLVQLSPDALDKLLFKRLQKTLAP